MLGGQIDRPGVAGDECLHPVGAGQPHFVGAMAVEIQRKGCCGVTQIFLYSFDVVPRAEGVYCIGVPEVMNPSLLYSNFWGPKANFNLKKIFSSKRVCRIITPVFYLMIGIIICLG